MGKNFLTIVYIAMMGMVAFTACGNKENKEPQTFPASGQ